MAVQQWARAVGTPPAGRRRCMVTARPYSLFTQGYQGGSGISRLSLNADLEVGPESVSIPVRVCARPYGDLPFEPRVRSNKIKICPGCGLVPPTGRGVSDQGKIQCQNCW